jgi:signal transduction histidine kinase
LSLVKAIVEAHHGTVAADEADGGGARFTVRLPAA